jgi:uncharacterized protein
MSDTQAPKSRVLACHLFSGVAFATLLIRIYQWTVSPLLGPTCRFHPSCSNYALEAINRFGVLRGGWLSVKRLGRCHPWHPGGLDPVPHHHGTSFCNHSAHD